MAPGWSPGRSCNRVPEWGNAMPLNHVTCRGCRATLPLFAAAVLAFAAIITAPAHAQRGFAPGAERAGPPQMQREPGSARMPEQRGPQSGFTQNRTPVSGEFHAALDSHGTWQHHSRFGDVWIPANRSRDWRPYTVGRWA